MGCIYECENLFVVNNLSSTLVEPSPSKTTLLVVIVLKGQKHEERGERREDREEKRKRMKQLLGFETSKRGKES